MKFQNLITFIRRHAVAAGKRFIPEPLQSILKKSIWKHTKHWKNLEQLAARMRKKEIITVAFMTLDLPCWKCDSLFRLMLTHPRFNPIIWIIPELQVRNKNEQERILEQMRAYFTKHNYPFVQYYTLEQMREEYAPDIVFLSKGPTTVCPWNAKNMEKELVCYVPYCYQNSCHDDFIFGQENHVWRNFYTTKNIKKIAAHCMNNGGLNIVPVGSPTADLYRENVNGANNTAWRPCGEKKKKVIWAPHWSVGNVSWFTVSTFLEVADGMLELAEKYADSIQWAFKPHPLLRDTLYNHPAWGKERTDAYYARWEMMPHSQLEEGAYEDLFKQSDAMIHDCGSFIMEYLLVNKPCMYLTRDKGFSDFNSDTLQAIDCYYQGSSIRDIECFLRRLKNNEPDELAEKRKLFIDAVLMPPGEKTAAQNIIDEILNGR